jgi:triosephosphate isomerase (TIM)
MTYIFGNWKMYLTLEESLSLAQSLADMSVPDGVQACVFPSMIAMHSVQESLAGSGCGVGVQHVAWTPRGAYTGEISAFIAKEAGSAYALVGHSERRHIFGETNDDVRKKLEACMESGLAAVLCIGETHEDKAQDKRTYRLKKQLMKALHGLSQDAPLLIAYEPVWAISGSGGGEACLPADVQDIHGWIRTEVAQYTDKDIPILYGGSVNQGNAASYIACDDVSGLLVGSASTHADSFAKIVAST